MTKGILNSAESVDETGDHRKDGVASGQEAKHLRRPGAFSGVGAEQQMADLSQDELALIVMYRQMPEGHRSQFISRCLAAADLPSPIATRLRALLR